jgi:sarcosine oxidase subunit beta
MENEKNFDAIIIGAGIIGLCVGYYLSIKNIKVLILEKDFINSGSTGACQCNLFIGSNIPSKIDNMLFDSLKEYETLNNKLSMNFEYKKCGSLLLVSDESQLNLARNFMEKRGLIFIDRKDIEENFISVSNNLIGGIFCKEDASINSLKFTDSIRAEILKTNSKIKFYEKVIEIKKYKNFFKVITNRGKYNSEKIINCGGIFSPNIAKMLNEKIPIIPSKGHVMVTEKSKLKTTASIREFDDICLNNTKVEEDITIKFVFQQTNSGNILIGKSEEIGNCKDNVSMDILTKISNRAIFFIPLLGNLKIIRSYVGFRPYCADGFPIIGESYLNKNFYYATGHSGSGITLGPITGKIISKIVTGGISDYDLNDFKPSRFEKMKIY